jgi:hypothetical protein
MRVAANPLLYKDDDAQSSILLDADQQSTSTNIAAPNFFAMVWQHWHDEVMDVD